MRRRKRSTGIDKSIQRKGTGADASPASQPPKAGTPAKKAGLIAAIVLAAIVIGSLGGGNGGSSDGGGGSDDAGAELACTHFNNIAADVRAGILTDGEIRTKLGEVYETSKGSEVASIRSASQRMYASATAGDADGLEVAVGGMLAACEAAGQ